MCSSVDLRKPNGQLEWKRGPLGAPEVLTYITQWVVLEGYINQTPICISEHMKW